MHREHVYGLAVRTNDALLIALIDNLNIRIRGNALQDMRVAVTVDRKGNAVAVLIVTEFDRFPGRAAAFIAAE